MSLTLTQNAPSSRRTLTKLRFVVEPCWLGKMLIACSEEGLAALFLGDEPTSLKQSLREQFPRADLVPMNEHDRALIESVSAFVNDPQIEFTFPLDLRGTPFQKQVWQALRRIPFGATTTYTRLAEAISQPKAVRAVAGACGANPIGLIIPCHRVIRSDGSLSGFGWGVERKRALLQREASGAPTSSTR